MAAANQMNDQAPADQMVWEAESLRLTLFAGASAPLPDPSWWLELFGEQPQTRVQSPKLSQLEERGPLGAGMLVLKTSPGRIDWLFTPVMQEGEGPPGELPGIGTFDDAIGFFLPPMVRWLKMSPPARRLALGTTVHQSVPDRQEGYRLLATYLQSVSIDIQNSSDFSYQINRPRPSMSGIAGLKINRLTKWSVASLVWHSVEAGAPMRPVRMASACRVELDINTAPDFQGELSNDQQYAVLEELTELTREILRRGDVP